MSWNVTSSHVLSRYVTKPCPSNLTSCQAILVHVTSRHTLSHPATSHPVTPHSVTPQTVTSHTITPHSVTSRHVIFCHTPSLHLIYIQSHLKRSCLCLSSSKLNKLLALSANLRPDWKKSCQGLDLILRRSLWLRKKSFITFLIGEKRKKEEPWETARWLGACSIKHFYGHN